MPISSHDYRKRDDYSRVFGVGTVTYVIGKPDTNFAQGLLTAPDNVVSIWKGPTHSGDADTGSNLTVHYARVAVTTADYVVCLKIGGKWYVEKLTC